MKNLVSIFFVLLLFSCSASSVKEEKNAPIDDYLETQDLNNKKIMIIREKINNNMTIKIFEGKTYYYEEDDKYVKLEGVLEPFYNKELWEKMKAKYENKSNTEDWLKEERWTRKDFRYKNIFFFKKEKCQIQENMKISNLMNIIQFLHFQNLFIMMINMLFLLL